ERILQVAREKQVDLIGLSGLITPSLDEMTHVARELERQGFDIPLLIGGATTSRAHTAVKIAPAYHQAVVHVVDASRAVGVVGNFKDAETSAKFADENRAEQTRLREQHSGVRAAPLVSLEEARRKRPSLDWGSYLPPKPASTGARVWERVPLKL